MYFSFKEITLRNLYNILTYIADFHLKIIALFNEKIKLGVRGRSETLSTLKSQISINEKTIWLHCASLGEYEQGLPVFEKIKDHYSSHKIILSFFSPSGYEIKKNTSIADLVVYLPLDTKSNARQFLNLVHPDLIVFVKYEIWPNYLAEVKNRSVKALLISASFRNDQSYFKPIGKWMLKSLGSFEHIFVQNEASKTILNNHGINHVTISGDTRFDRVSNQLQSNNSLPFIEDFKRDKLCFVAGSTWPEDEKLLVEFINSDSSDTKFIIAPHNIKTSQIENLKNSLTKSVVLFSQKDALNLSEFKVLLLDTIGLLSKTYAYADIAYVGGAVGKTGLHNTLEPAVFGIPLIIGTNYNNFPEAVDMIAIGGMFPISSQKELDSNLNYLIENSSNRNLSGKKNADFIVKNKGAVIQIMQYIRR